MFAGMVSFEDIYADAPKLLLRDEAKQLLANSGETSLNATQMYHARPKRAALGQTYVWPNFC